MAQSPQPVARGLHLVLFGMAGSGKSALLGALVQAAQGQQQVLGGRLDDIPDGLDELRKSLHDNKPRATLDEIVLYPLTFHGPAGPTPLTLCDCDGRVAQAYLAGAKGLDGADGDTALGQAVQHADTLILTIDAATPPAQLDRDFAQCGAFLRLFEEQRGRVNEEAGLPVYLVLTKCDLLGKPDDSASQWMQRIEEGKRQVDLKFREFLARRQQEGAGLFGAVDLHIWATAVKRPNFGDRPAKAAEPFGVAELFRQAIDSGLAFHRQRARSGRKLVGAAVAVSFLVGFLGVLAAFFFLNRPSPDLAALEHKVKVALPANPADRLREPMDQRFEQLLTIMSDPTFPQLPAKMQDDVTQTSAELEAYQAWSKRFKQVQDPRHILNEKELGDNEKLLAASALPDQYADNWSNSKLAQRRRQWQGDLKKLRAAVEDEIAWMHGQIKEGEQLRERGGLVLAKKLTKEERKEWDHQVKQYLDRDVRYQRIPGVPTLTYDVYRFDLVDQARRDWEQAKKKLEKVRDFAQ